jgi:hypothetical protein
MSKKVLFGTILLLMVGLLASCSGVKQSDLDAANAAKTAAETQVASLQSQLTTAKTATTQAQNELTTTQQLLTDANAKIADLQKLLSGLAPTLSFESQTFFDSTNKFTFFYPKTWTQPVYFTLSDTWLAWLVEPEYLAPAVQMNKLPDTIATLSDVFTKNLGLSNARVTSTSTATNSHGIKADVLEGTYAPDATSTLNVKVFGFKQGGYWWVMWFYQSPLLGDLKGGGAKPVYCDEIFSTWQFIK